MERILGPAPALPVALPTPIGTPASVPRVGASHGAPPASGAQHFRDRFGAAIRLTVVNAAVQGAVNSKNSSGSVVISPSTSAPAGNP
jgi:hypothetical protein